MNYINKKLADEQGLTKGERSYLNALHYAMEVMVDYYNLREWTPKEAKELRKKVRNLEYLMQDIWGFSPNELKHTHWKRFHALNPPGTQTVTYAADNALLNYLIQGSAADTQTLAGYVSELPENLRAILDSQR